MWINLDIELGVEGDKYLDASARIRLISRTKLVQKVVQRVIDDQLVLAVLDDNSRPDPNSKEFRQRERRSAFMEGS